MILKEVGGDKILKRMFLEFPVSLYASDPNWIRPLDQDIEVIFDPNKNFHLKKFSFKKRRGYSMDFI